MSHATSDESRSLLLSHTFFFTLHYVSRLHLTNLIDDTMIIHLHMVSSHTIIASYCIIVTP